MFPAEHLLAFCPALKLPDDRGHLHLGDFPQASTAHYFSPSEAFSPRLDFFPLLRFISNKTLDLLP